MLFVVKLFYFVYFVRIGFCYNVIDVDDILSDDLMPGNLLMLENANGSDTKDNITTGSLNDAMSTMDFHRSKMNEYLCRNYLAEQIVQDMTIPTFSRRSSTNPLNSKESLMIDEGSKSYKDWLSKSATLEDIYRHYNTQSNPTQSRRNDEVRNEEENEEYDTHVTNYVYEHPAKHTTYNLYGSGSGYGLATPSLSYYPSTLNGNSNYGTVSVHSYDSNHANQNYSPKYNKEKDVTDLFDIALTALAYLSFGMFIVHVVMCIAAVTNNTTTVVTMMPMSMGPEPTGEGMITSTTENGMGGDMTMTMTGNGGNEMTGNGNEGEEMTGEGGGMTGNGNGGDSMTGEGDGMTGNGEGMTGNGNGGDEMTGEGGGMTGNGNGDDGMTGEGGGMTGNGNGGDEMTGEGGGMAGNGNGGDGMTGNGEGMTGNGNGGDEMTGEGGGMTGNGEGMTGNGNGGDEITGEGGGMTGNGNGDDGMTGEGNGMTGNGNGGDGITGEGGENGNGGDGATGNGDEDEGMTGEGVANGGDGMTAFDEGEGKVTAREQRFTTLRNIKNSPKKLKSFQISVEEAVRIKDNLNFRHKRQAQSDININELARKILTSIEAALVANEDKGSCLRLQLCENNKYSRGLNDNGKLWIPVWSLGMSWLSGKLIKNVPAATSMLDGLKASILGLGKANCDRIYKDCNLHDERIKQKVKRKK
ncbi:uncharacterized protein [Onthophagus taurus]|uniref:uncharacterized protein isoform X2 n=1 Tax=Onthophagus taurus TaxID=166361 RepID=UPI0039BE3A80